MGKGMARRRVRATRSEGLSSILSFAMWASAKGKGEMIHLDDDFRAMRL